MRIRFTPVYLAAFITLAAVACSSAASSTSAGDTGVLAPPGGQTAATSAPAASASHPPAAPSGLRKFAFPPSVRVEFHTPLPASGPRRAAMIGYENYVDSMWYAVVSHGASKVYLQYAGGNARTFVQGVMGAVPVGYRISGTIVYYSISVPQVFYGAGAVVQSCVDASGLYRVNATTGKRIGTIFSPAYDHYQEQASAGQAAAGFWTVSHTANTPASDGGSAGMCV